MNNRCLTGLVLFFAALILSGCGGCFGKMTAGELACDALSIESTRVEPYTWATLHVDFAEELSEDTGKIEVLAELTMVDWEPAPVALRSWNDNSLQWHVPLFIADPMSGGAATLQLTAAGEICNPMNIDIAPLVPAPGATLELMAKTIKLREADAAVYGFDLEEMTNAINFDTLEFDTSLPLPVWSHALSIAATDHPNLEPSFYDALENEISSPDVGEWVVVLDAIIAASYDFDELVSLTEWINQHPIEGLSFAEYNDPSLILQQNTGIPIFLPEIDDPNRLSELMIHSATRCAIDESGAISDATMNALSSVTPAFEGLLDIAQDMNKESAETIEDLIEEIDAGDEFRSSFKDWQAANRSAFDNIDAVLTIVGIMTTLDRALNETIRGGCQLLPSQIDALSGNTPWYMSEDTNTPLELTPLNVNVSSQEYDIPNFIELIGGSNPLERIDITGISSGIWDLSTSIEKQEDAYRSMADSVSGTWLLDVLNVDQSLANFLDDIADELENLRTLGPFSWSVQFPEISDGTNEWMDVNIGRGVVIEHRCNSGQGFCVRPNQRVGTDWVDISLNAALFPQWKNVVQDLNAAEVAEMSFDEFRESLESDRPSFTSLMESIDVRPISIELIPRRTIGVEPGDLVQLKFIVKNADYPEALWSLSDGTFSSENYFLYENQHLSSGPSQDSAHVAGEPYEEDHSGELYIDVPTDAGFVFPILIRGEMFWEPGPWMDPNRNRSVTGYIDGDRAHIVPKVACLTEGQQISVQLFGRYQQDNQVSWSASAGSIEARDDDDGSGIDRAIYTAPNSEEDEITISATISGRSITGESQESRAEVTYSMDCKCWWTAEFDGGAKGTMGGYKATVGRGIFQQILGSHNVSLSDENSDDGLMFGFPGQDELQGSSFNASLHIFAEREDLLGGSLVEADMGQAYGLSLPKQITFTNYMEPYYSGRFTGTTLTVVEVLLHQVWQRPPIPTTITAEFFADSVNDCKTRRWFN